MRPHLTASGRIWGYALRTLCGLIFLFMIAPLLVVLPLSFNSERYFTYPMAGVSLRWYEYFLTSERWQLALTNSFVVAGATTALATSLGTLAALGLARGPFPLRPMISGLLILPLIVPVVVTAVGTYFFFAKVNLVGTYLGIILAHTLIATPFVVICVTATLTGFDKTLVRAGASLGAGPLRVFYRVTIPLILPGLVTGALFAFVTSFDEVVLALFLTGPEQYTLPRAMWSGVREQIDPTILAVACLFVVVSVFAMGSVEWLRRRNRALRGLGH